MQQSSNSLDGPTIAIAYILIAKSVETLFARHFTVVFISSCSCTWHRQAIQLSRAPARWDLLRKQTYLALRNTFAATGTNLLDCRFIGDNASRDMIVLHSMLAKSG
jgi:hypothetical protein